MKKFLNKIIIIFIISFGINITYGQSINIPQNKDNKINQNKKVDMIYPFNYFKQNDCPGIIKKSYSVRYLLKQVQDSKNNDISLNESISVSPLPANDNIKLNIPVVSECNAIIELYSVNGIMLLNKSTNLNANCQNVDFNVSNFDNGVYYFIIKIGTAKYAKKIIIFR